MVSVNKIILAGTVGSASVVEVSGKKLMRFTVATNRAYLDADNTPVVVTTWFNCKFWEGRRRKFPDGIKKGDSVSLTGRMDSVRYAEDDGVTRTMYEVLVTSVKVVKEKVELEIEKSDF